MANDPSLTVLRALKSLENTGSVSKTAVTLRLTQSAVSRAIANYEKSIGLELLRRDTRPLRLTEEGLLVASHALEIDRSLLTLQERLQSVKEKKSGTVRIGSFGPTASTRILPALIANFAQSYPKIAVSIDEGTDNATRFDFVKDNVDVAVLFDPVDDFDAISVATDQLVALVKNGTPLSSKAVIEPVHLGDLPFIMTLSGSEPAILDWFFRSNVQPDIRHRVQQTHSILALVRSGLGQAIVTSMSLPKEIDGVTAIPLHPSSKREIFLVKKPGSARSNAVGVFWEFAGRSFV
ncbi:MAG: LysR family transcriptional regulator [Roseovarius sp.]|jgi:DNA-binding transcriptional LysR family regulator|nr:LysR family transcriptional regulator [Roseovarius sp.]